MKLIVGLGNPGLLYRNTRHNIGRDIVEKMAKIYKVKLKKDKKLLACLGKGSIEGRDFILSYPLVFMNLSGEAVINLINRFKINKENLLVICDDLDLKLGVLRIKPSGGDGGHRGLRSIIENLANNDFARLRIGIGRLSDKEKIKDFVLSKFNKSEKLIIEEAKSKAIECCKVWLLEGIEVAMNKFN